MIATYVFILFICVVVAAILWISVRHKPMMRTNGGGENKRLPNAPYIIETFERPEDVKLALDRLTIPPDYDHYHYFGKTDKLQSGELVHYFVGMGNNLADSKTIVDHIMRIKDRYMTNDSMWFTIRAQKDRDEKLYRWHTDGKYFEKVPKANIKLVASLKGPGTPLIETTPERIEIINNINDNDAKITPDMSMEEKQRAGLLRRKLSTARIKNPKITIANNDEIVLFKYGTDKSAIHSEPLKYGDRLFISMLPGTERQIRHMLTYRKGKYIGSSKK